MRGTATGLLALAVWVFGLLSSGRAAPVLEAHWALDDGPPSTTAADSADSHPATLAASPADPSWVSDTAPLVGPNPYALAFDGDDRVTALGYTGVAGTEGRSVSAWIKTVDMYDFPSILGWGREQPGERWSFRAQRPTGPLPGTLRVDVNGGYQIGSTFITDGRWHHVVAVLPEGIATPSVTNVQLYVDGQLEAISAQASRSINTWGGQDVLIGVDAINNYFEGLIDDVQVYRGALSAADVAALAQRSVPVPTSYREAVLLDDPIAYWRLSAQSSPTEPNLGFLGSAVNGTHSGGVAQGVPGLLATDPDLAASFNGATAYVNVPNHAALNGVTGEKDLGPYIGKTVELWFRAAEIVSRQVLFEEGGGTNGLNVYIEDGQLHVAAWNLGRGQTPSPNQPATPWDPKRVSVAIAAGETYMVDLVLSCDLDSFDGYLEGYLNGLPFSDWGGTSAQSGIGRLLYHPGLAAIGAMQNDSMFWVGGVPTATTGTFDFWFGGTIDDVSLYNYALTDTQVGLHCLLATQEQFIPEPGTLVLLGAGLLALGRRGRRKSEAARRREGA
ncbi:MAG TPA: LamG domain-containing protein [Planctomycetota bacterium]|nr:LamG domain-containing protein [Planctomycetota bacterium]